MHGRGFVAPTDVQCRVDGEVVNGVAVDDTRIACEPMAAAPIVDDPVQGARLSGRLDGRGGGRVRGRAGGPAVGRAAQQAAGQTRGRPGARARS